MQRTLAVKLLEQAASQAGLALNHYKALSAPEDADTERARQAMQIIDVACQRLYFSSGAFQRDDKPLAPLGLETAAIFLQETNLILRQIGEHGGPQTVYYLIQLPEQLMDADPAGVFDLIVSAVLQGGQGTGDQFEHLAADLMVKIVGRFRADHKEIFDDPRVERPWSTPSKSSSPPAGRPCAACSTGFLNCYSSITCEQPAWA